MPEYRWKGKDQFGNSVKGVLIADDREQARQRLFAQGIFLSSLNKNWQFFRIRAFSIHIRKVQFEVQSF